MVLGIDPMAADEMRALLVRASFGHLACARDNRPYVVPMNYAYDGHDLYFFTTEGTKTEIINANPEVCFQVEEVADSSHWRSVMVVGAAHSLARPDEVERAMRLITERNPTLTPALNQTEVGAWERPSNIALYRLRPRAVSGRKTV